MSIYLCIEKLLTGLAETESKNEQLEGRTGESAGAAATEALIKILTVVSRMAASSEGGGQLHYGHVHAVVHHLLRFSAGSLEEGQGGKQSL